VVVEEAVAVAAVEEVAVAETVEPDPVVESV
jgi:hypothetical protein